MSSFVAPNGTHAGQPLLSNGMALKHVSILEQKSLLGKSLAKQ